MRKGIKTVFISVACLVVPGIIAVLLMFAASLMEMGGIWPYRPLANYLREIPMENGGALLIEGKETRSFAEQGFSERVSYRPPGSAEVEPIGNWNALLREPQIFLSGPLVIVVGLERQTVYVRTHPAPRGAEEAALEPESANILHSVPVTNVEERWKALTMIFPTDLHSFPPSYYPERNGISVEDLQRIREGLDDEEKRWSPAAGIESFDPQTRELVVSYAVGMVSTRYLHLQLSEDGTQLSLVKVEKRDRGSSR